MAETSKAAPRRLRERNIAALRPARTLDVGAGEDPIGSDVLGFDDASEHEVVAWDILSGDAHHLDGIENASFDLVYSSHLLEHLTFPVTALRRWWSVLKPGGNLVLYVPHRDLYERRKELPSRWNPEHKLFILPDACEPPHTFSLRGMVRAAGIDIEPKWFGVCDEGWDASVPINDHPVGEYSIEGCWEKV